MIKPKIAAIAPQLVVKDVVRTAEYYRDILGFNIISYFADPPVYAMVERDGLEIHFGRADGDGINSNEQFRKIASDLIIWVPEIELFFEEVRLKDAVIAEGIVQRSYGKEFIIRDCDGHKILVVTQ
jgi:hypothetical protein